MHDWKIESLHTTYYYYYQVAQEDNILVGSFTSYMLHTTFIQLSIPDFAINRNSLLHVIIQFKIDHDYTCGTVSTDYAMRQLDRNNLMTAQNLIYRHIGKHCVNNQCVFDLFTIIFLLVGDCNFSRNFQKQILCL